MKKIITLLALLCMSTVGWSQSQITATLMEGYGDPLTLDQFTALAGTNGRFGFVASSNTADSNHPRCDHWCGFTSTHNTTTLSDNFLFYLEKSGSNYLVKRASDNRYVKTSTSSTSFGERKDGTAFKLVNRDPNDATKAVSESQSISFEDPEDSNYHYNANAVKYNDGAGAWTTYAVFGPIYKNITIDCQENGVSMSGYPQVSNYKIGGDVSAPVFSGKRQVAGDPTSVTIDQDNMVITFNYEECWPVNFDKSTVSTHNSRYTDMVGLDDQKISWSSHAKDVIYRDLTDQTITIPAGKTVTPVIGYRGWAMYGYLYIDYNNDGDFTDGFGELQQHAQACRRNIFKLARVKLSRQCRHDFFFKFRRVGRVDFPFDLIHSTPPISLNIFLSVFQCLFEIYAIRRGCIRERYRIPFSSKREHCA